MSRRKSLGEIVLPNDEESRRLAIEWSGAVVEQVLDLVWRGFDLIASHELKDGIGLAELHPEQLERELTQWHFLAIQRIWKVETNGFPSFQPIHEPHEFETRKGGNAMPPSCDIGFIHSDNRRWQLPVEAKVLWSSKALSEYLEDVTVKYAAGVAAPLVGECGMVGYLLKGTADEVFAGLASRLGQSLERVVRFADRAHKTTVHVRATAPMLRVHHMVMSFVPLSG